MEAVHARWPEEIVQVPVQPLLADDEKDIEEMEVEVEVPAVPQESPVNVGEQEFGSGKTDEQIFIENRSLAIVPLAPPHTHAILLHILAYGISPHSSVTDSSNKRNWAEAFEEETAVFNPSCSDNVVVRTVRTPAVNQNRSPVATREQIVENSQDASTPMLLIKFQSTAKKPSVRADKGKKIVPSVADASYRRVTRSVTSNKGYRAPPIQELLPRPHKRSRKVVPVESLALDNSQAQDKGKKTKSKQRMANQSIPVQVLQHIGGLLDMQPEDITEAKLNAEPSKTSSASVPDV